MEEGDGHEGIQGEVDPSQNDVVQIAIQEGRTTKDLGGRKEGENWEE